MLDAEQKKSQVGMSTNFNIIQAQRDLAARAECGASGGPRLSEGDRRIGETATSDESARQSHDHQRIKFDGRYAEPLTPPTGAVRGVRTKFHRRAD
jgi:hypothetical protein